MKQRFLSLLENNTLCFFDTDDLAAIGWSLINKFYADEATCNTACYDISAERLIIKAYHPAYWRINQETYYSEIITAVKYWNSIHGR